MCLGIRCLELFLRFGERLFYKLMTYGLGLIIYDRLSGRLGRSIHLAQLVSCSTIVKGMKIRGQWVSLLMLMMALVVFQQWWLGKRLDAISTNRIALSTPLTSKLELISWPGGNRHWVQESKRELASNRRSRAGSV
jgi:hypothetical protein